MKDVFGQARREKAIKSLHPSKTGQTAQGARMGLFTHTHASDKFLEDRVLGSTWWDPSKPGRQGLRSENGRKYGEYEAVCLIVEFLRIGDSFGSGITGRAEIFVLCSREFYLLGFLLLGLWFLERHLGLIFIVHVSSIFFVSYVIGITLSPKTLLYWIRSRWRGFLRDLWWPCHCMCQMIVLHVHVIAFVIWDSANLNVWYSYIVWPMLWTLNRIWKGDMYRGWGTFWPRLIVLFIMESYSSVIFLYWSSKSSGGPVGPINRINPGLQFFSVLV